MVIMKVKVLLKICKISNTNPKYPDVFKKKNLQEALNLKASYISLLVALTKNNCILTTKLL